MPKPTDAWFGWFIQQLKSQLRGIRIFLTEGRSLSPMPGDLWNIVVDYVCEDPAVVDIIIGITDPWIIDFGPDSWIGLSWGHDGIGETSELVLECAGKASSGCPRFRSRGGTALQILLMLPNVDDSGASRPTKPINPDARMGVVAIRRALYKRLQNRR